METKKIEVNLMGMIMILNLHPNSYDLNHMKEIRARSNRHLQSILECLDQSSKRRYISLETLSILLSGYTEGVFRHHYIDRSLIVHRSITMMFCKKAGVTIIGRGKNERVQLSTLKRKLQGHLLSNLPPDEKIIR